MFAGAAVATLALVVADSSCASHAQCWGIQGDCCPDNSGLMWQCCEAACMQRVECLGKEGNCCPRDDGSMDECCQQAHVV
mmetsp:Transcript_32449/g.70981  ORF Transcript_32449/g.70981 Transcript_32449/m.70981 type:complete len:80 (+) Transcript_32449:42-281(+)